MIEMGEKEAAEAVADKEAAETAAHAALMKGANLEVTQSPLHSTIFALDLHDQKLSAMSICGKGQDPQSVRD